MIKILDILDTASSTLRNLINKLMKKNNSLNITLQLLLLEVASKNTTTKKFC